MPRCADCYDACQFFEMAAYENNSTTYDCQGRSGDMYVGWNAFRWRLLSRSCPGIFFNMFDLDMVFVCHATYVKYVRRMRQVSRTDFCPTAV